MLKISRVSDYGLLAMVYLGRRPGEVISTREIAQFYALPLPMVSKVLKALHEGGMISSRRGAVGGYAFEGDRDAITLGRLLEILEGPWDLVECETTNSLGNAVCTIRHDCPSRSFMSGINRAIKHAFDRITLGELVRDAFPGALITSKMDLRGDGAEELQ
jgi:Rrf2 family nitric oxide-sensitive transcriptional repressor